MSLRWGWLLIAGVLACSGSPQLLDSEGDACRTLDELCVGTNEVMQCIDGRLVVEDCDAICGSLAPGVESSGCVGLSSGDEGCACMPPAGGCMPSDTNCSGDDQLDLCAQDWQWMSFDCAEVCAQQVMHTVSLGCVNDAEQGAACSCTSEGTACMTEAPLCVDESTLAICEGGVWSYLACAELCDADKASCQPQVGDGALCVCD